MYNPERQENLIVQNPVKLLPYNISHFRETDNYSFTTEQGISYYCRFGNIMSLLPPLLGIYDIEVNDFIFYPDSNSEFGRIKYDARVALTLIDLIRNHYFIAPEKVLVYTCDDTDRNDGGKCRQKLFGKWLKPLADEIRHFDLEIMFDAEKETTSVYAGIIVRNDFPYPEVLKKQLLEEAAQIVVEKFG